MKHLEIRFINQNVILRLKKIFPNAKIFFTIKISLILLNHIIRTLEKLLKFAPMPFKGRFIKFNDWFDYEVENLHNSFYEFNSI